MNIDPYHIRQAVILAGGLGSRLRPLTDHLPKPMIAFHGRPFAAYLLEMLKQQGVEEAVFLLGYLPEVVMQYFGDGKQFGISIKYSVQPVDTETGARLRGALDLLEDRFLLLYCDNYWPMQLDRMTAQWRGAGTEALLAIYSNDDHYTKDNVRVSDGGIIELYDKSRTTLGLHGVEIGFGLFRKSHVESLPPGNISLEKTLYPELVSRKQLSGYVTSHRYYSVGSLERLPGTAEFLAFRPAIFLDRDGVLNHKAPRGEYICSADQFRWIPGSLDGLKILTQAGYRIFIISNQAGIARGNLSEFDLKAIHDKMVQDAADIGARIDAIYVCPHGWDADCACRKPKPGLLFQAQREQSLDLTRIWFLGDDERDMEAGLAAGCRCGRVTSEKPFLEWVGQIVESGRDPATTTTLL